jgi:hypothetical protein
MEAEYNALTETTTLVIWLRSLMEELGFLQKAATTIFEDNGSAIIVASSWKQHTERKHYRLKEYCIRERVIEKKDITLVQLPTGEMVADMFTKQLPHPVFSRHRHSLGI